MSAPRRHALRHLPAVLVALLVLACLALLGAAAVSWQPEAAVVVPAGQRSTGNLATIRAPIVVDGEVPGDVTSWGGDIVVRGRVGGDVVSYAGHITVEPPGKIDGSVMSLGGVRPAAAVSIAGQAIDGGGSRAVASVFEVFFPTPGAPVSRAGAVLRGLFAAALVVLLAALMVLWAALWPRRTATAAATLTHAAARSVAVGLLTTAIGAALFIPIAALLAGSVVGVPLLVLLLLGIQLPYIYGLTVLTQAIGARLGGRMWVVAAAVAAIALGIGAATLASPVAGFGLFALLACPGVGATILSRGGLVVQPPIVPAL